MARQIIDIQPHVTVSPSEGEPNLTMEAARLEADDIEHSIRQIFGSSVDVRVTFDIDARCEHCRAVWTEDSATYNGGCCIADEVSSPTLTEGK